jgi:hypothetical protein
VSLRIAALGLLAQEPGSGYDLLRRFEKSMANVWPATQSQLYGELNKLADAGLAELRRWVADTQDDPPFRDAGLLRVFLLGEVSPGEARDRMLVIAEAADTEVKRLEQLRDSVEWADDDASFYGYAALEHGLRNHAMEADWARWLVAAIGERSGQSRRK